MTRARIRVDLMSMLSGYRWRARFAWLPVALWRVGPCPYVTKTRRQLWLRIVVEIKTALEGWVAYDDLQPQGRG